MSKYESDRQKVLAALNNKTLMSTEIAIKAGMSVPDVQYILMCLMEDELIEEMVTAKMSFKTYRRI